MEYLQSTDHPSIRYQLSFGGQKKLYFPDRRYLLLDGYDEVSRTAWEFHGCYFHGHPRCKDGTFCSQTAFRSSGKERFSCTLRRENLIRTHPDVSRLFVIWECEWNALVKSDEFMRQFVKEKQPIKPATLRESFKGGYTNVCSLFGDRRRLIEKMLEKHPEYDFQTLQQKIKIVFLDVNSQYPSQFLRVKKGERPAIRIPVSPPIMLYYPKTELKCVSSCCPFQNHRESSECYLNNCTFICPDHCPPSAWFYGEAVGYAKVKILPHRSTRIPLLSVKIKKSGQDVNITTCCRTCTEIHNDFIDVPPCTHTDLERCIEGCWNLHELAFAVRRQKYCLLHIYSTVFFRETRDDALEGLMTVLAETKILSSGIPTDEAEDPVVYINRLNRERGFNLREPDFIPSLSMRNGAKWLMVTIKLTC